MRARRWSGPRSVAGPMEFRSRASLFGLPLVHVTVGRVVDGQLRRGIATGWIAVGDVAFGVLFACGGVAVGGLSVGGASLGALSLGGLAIGLGAMGGLAVGLVAAGGAAFAWYLALGGLAVARDTAFGGLALARHVAGATPAEAMPGAPIPHLPFHWPDAVAMIGVALVAFALLARRVHRAGTP